jgi:ABC-type molybdate transport system substrate-binding protein
MEAGGTVTVGNMTWTVPPDVYLAGLAAVQKQIGLGRLANPAVPYVTNTLTIMVAKDNPTHIASLTDLGKDSIRLAMPNPEFEGIAHQIQNSLKKAGGEALLQTVYSKKVADGSTTLTRIHHRQTPLWILQGKADAGVTWQSEARFQELIGHPIAHVAIPDAQNTRAIYAGAIVTKAAHRQAAQRWLNFIRSSTGLAIFERYGFKAYNPRLDHS